MRYSLPVDYPSGNCIIIAIDTRLAPIISSQLSDLLEARLWTKDSYQAGYYAIAEVMAQMSNNCFSNLIQELRDFRGVKPDFIATPVEERTSDMYNSLNDLFTQLLELRGIMDDGWFTDTYTSLKDVVQAQRGTDAAVGTDIWEQVAELFGETSTMTDIAGTLIGFLTDQEQTAVQGGLALGQMAMQAATVAAIQQLALNQVLDNSTLVAILHALRGDTAPVDNILQSIRGDTAADVDRNILQALS
jgi:hypothetical protein